MVAQCPPARVYKGSPMGMDPAERSEEQKTDAVNRFLMSKMIHGGLSAILTIVVGVGAILALAGCRSHDYPGPDNAIFYPPGYPTGPQRPFAQDSRQRPGVRERRGARQDFPGGSTFWNGDHLSGSPSIKINLREQRAYFYKGRELAGVSPVSTGRPGYDTPTGSFRITQKSPRHRSNLYGDYVDAQGNVVSAHVDVRRDKAPPGTTFRGASMPHFLRFNDAIGMHGGHLPGYPASSGCVRLPAEMARHFFANAPSGTPVMVVR